jgi:hypothetical protein
MHRARPLMALAALSCMVAAGRAVAVAAEPAARDSWLETLKKTN